MFDFPVESGLRPEHRLCDFGCGAIRFGAWAIPYLDAGNYFGIDSHSHFGATFDRVVDFSSTQKVDPPGLTRLFGNLVESLAPGGRFLTAPRLSASSTTEAGHGRSQHAALDDP
jgi:hypothetical protein